MNNKILNSKIKSGAGFTMIELLAVSIVVIAVSSIITAILFSSLRGVSKTSVTDAVRQNGNSAISKVSREIKFAKTFNGVSTTGIGVYETNCSIYGITPAPPTVQYKYLKITDLDSIESIFSCKTISSVESLYQKTGASTPVSLFDTDTVRIESGLCYFTCTQNVETDTPTIGIYFKLSQKGDDTSFFEKKSSAEFQTSATFRNLNK
ncbi:MAG: hypothetical protein ACD_50C00146G0001 [uncultured bacterium]|nr:MAG: hypothetical protein ACD_50C00146G0001 [uncultured bacterium]KKR15697.1 MAG: hypothetical protein UT46_C0015G0004 [Candidatus Levybacteria bacterium GW2011_GWA1_39_34]KKR50143.1 MAG: hypothetical protein UT87_C0020G0031 [Candidatus Levybacteria bacterium GW2011_GWC1_40_19]KKR73143.1 MAG: hypothetical protein UU15_C0018G0013 [Candidatus Levybacteria bacterium GW2011_GWC2_40_7]KKR94989.1 MAG: hypothetical protein UU45_C0005G0047 [Candidatus Levybacteria bacterium GW2011_GWA2_41_15]KKS012